MDKAQKRAFVKDLNVSLSEAESVVVSHYRGLTVADLTQYRRSMRELGGSVKVAKIRLAKIAFKGTNFENLDDLMVGPTIIASAADPISAAKITHEFAKTNKDLVILGGTVGTENLDVAGVKALAVMPSLDELRAKLIGIFSAPAQQLATVTQAPAAGLARQLAAKPE